MIDKSGRSRALVLGWLLALGLAALLWGLRSATPPAALVGERGEAHLPRKTSSKVAPVQALVALAPTQAPALFGSVQALGGAALPGATVCFVNRDQAGCGVPECTRSDAKGWFHLATGCARGGTLLASAVGHEPLTRRLDGAASLPLLLALRAGGERISGSVVDAAGGPIPGAVVSAGDASGSELAIVIADDSGQFRLEVAAGPTRVRARADGYSQREREVNAPIAGLQLVLSAAAAIAGRVLSEDQREPIAGAAVTVRPLDGIRAAPITVQSDAGGEFRFDDLSAGRYAVVALAAAWRSDEQHVPVSVAEVADGLELIARRASQVTGVVSVDGEPCQRGSVYLTGAVHGSAALEPDGHVTFAGIPPGRYEVVISCEGALEQSESLDVGTELVERAWTLERGLAVTGVARRHGGDPFAGAPIHVIAVGEPSGRPNVRCVSDEGGEFACGGLLPGTYDCAIGSGPQPRSDLVRVSVSDGPSPRISLRARAAATLRVSLMSAEGFELPATVLLAQRQGEDPVLAELRGEQFVFESLALGSYEVWSEATPRGSPQQIQLTHDGQVAELRLEAPRPHTLSGRVVDPAGNGVVDAWVRAQGDSIYAHVLPATPVLTDPEGAFHLVGLLPGQYRIAVSSEQGEAYLDAVESNRSDVVVRISPYGSLSGSVVNSTGDAVGTFALAYHDVDDGQGAQMAGSRGVWSIPWLAPGKYSVQVTSPEGRASQIVEIPPGEDVTLQLQLVGAALP